MKINVGKAAKLFFSGTSLETIYYEAVANAIDAEATAIDMHIYIKSFLEPETLKIEITDNGIGFQDKNFDKFSTLLENEEREDHKGIGRLVFLNYFREISITSTYLDPAPKKRTFIFNETFEGKSKVVDTNSSDPSVTKLLFSGYKLEKINSYNYLIPSSIKEALLLHFYPLFYSLKIRKKKLKITITLNAQETNIGHGFVSSSVELIVSQLPGLQKETFTDERINLFENLELLYSIKENPNPKPIITGICVDGRAITVDILTKDEVPNGYELIFLLYSDYFTGMVDSSRQNLTLTSDLIRTVKAVFSEKISSLLHKNIPKIDEKNKKINESLTDRFPHLQGYFDESPVGLIDRKKSLYNAQTKFLIAQQEILDNETLSDDQYMKSLEMSSRILTEYILYRNLIINKLKAINPNDKESDLHSIIVPMKRTFSKHNALDNLYTNNVWLLDDKYMTYSTILSDKDIGDLVTTITKEDTKDSSFRPDIAIVFSDDINKAKKIDVVIVELKRLGIDSIDKSLIYPQLIQRATNLLKYYPNKIQRIWFYGIIDFDPEIKLLLINQGFTELYSNGTVLFQNQNIDIGNGTKVPTGFFIQSYDALIEDAESRNSTFLNILKEGLKAE
jgi:hypothetical protein